MRQTLKPRDVAKYGHNLGVPITTFIWKKKKKRFPEENTKLFNTGLDRFYPAGTRTPKSLRESCYNCSDLSHQYSGLENSVDYSPWGHKESDMTERLSLSRSHQRSKIDPNKMTHLLKQTLEDLPWIYQPVVGRWLSPLGQTPYLHGDFFPRRNSSKRGAAAVSHSDFCSSLQPALEHLPNLWMPVQIRCPIANSKSGL